MVLREKFLKSRKLSEKQKWEFKMWYTGVPHLFSKEPSLFCCCRVCFCLFVSVFEFVCVRVCNLKSMMYTLRAHQLHLVKLMLGVGSPGSLHTATSAISEAYKTCCQASHLQR